MASLQEIKQGVGNFANRFRQPKIAPQEETPYNELAQELTENRQRHILNRDLYAAIQASSLVHFQTSTDPGRVARELVTIGRLSGPPREVIAWTTADAAYNVATGKMIVRIDEGTHQTPEGQQIPTAGNQRWETLSQMLSFIEQYPRPAIFHLPNFHLTLASSMQSHQILDSIMRIWQQTRRFHKTIVISSPPGTRLPEELAGLCPVVKEVPLTRSERETMVQVMLAETQLQASPKVLSGIIDATTGLNALQTDQAIKVALVREFGLDNMAGHIGDWKRKQITSSGKWEALRTNDVPEIVGWDALTEFFDAHIDDGAFAPHSDFNISLLTLVGQAGTGKTTMAQILGNRLGWPVYKARVDQWMGSLMGQTEQGFAAAVADARAAQPCIAFIDEAQRALQSGDQATGGGTMHRSMGTLLDAIEESRKAGEQILWIFTANTHEDLAPELLNRGVVFGIPFPGPQQRAEIWKSIFSRLKNKNPEITMDPALDASAVAQLTQDMAGRDMEKLMKTAKVFGKGRINLLSIEQALRFIAKQRDIHPTEIAAREEALAHFPSVSSETPRTDWTTTAPLGPAIEFQEMSDEEAAAGRRSASKRNQGFQQVTVNLD